MAPKNWTAILQVVQITGGLLGYVLMLTSAPALESNYRKSIA